MSAANADRPSASESGRDGVRGRSPRAGKSDLTGRAGLVTGAGSGIGRATAVRLAAAGAQVVAADRDEQANAETVRMIADAGGTAIAVTCDIVAPDEVDAMVATAVTNFGRLDFAHNNAGVVGAQRRLVDYTLDDYDRVIGVNLRGTFL